MPHSLAFSSVNLKEWEMHIIANVSSCNIVISEPLLVVHIAHEGNPGVKRETVCVVTVLRGFMG